MYRERREFRGRYTKPKPEIASSENRYFNPDTATDEEFDAYVKAEELRASRAQSGSDKSDEADILESLEKLKQKRREQKHH